MIDENSVSTSSESPKAVPLRAVWNRDFLLYFVGVIFSLSGFWVRFVAQSWLVYRLTDSAWLLGLVGFLTTLPVFLFSPFAGVIVDRVSRRLLLTITQSGMAITMVTLAILDTTNTIAVWHVMVIAFIGGSISALDWPTRLSLVPNLVPPHVLPRAVALNSAAWNGARLGGPVLAGLMLPVIGTAGSFWVAGLLFLPVLVILPFIRVRHASQRPRSGAFLANLRGGYAYVFGSSVLLTLLLLELVPIVFGQTFPILMPVFVSEVLRTDVSALGWLMASLGAGELVGTLMIALTTVPPRRPLSVLVGVFAFGALMITFAFSRSLPLSMLCLALIGLAGAAYSTLNGTLIQAAVEDQYRGRVMSVYSMIWGMTPIGNLQLGAVAEAFSAPMAVALNGLIVILFVLVLLARVPRIRAMPAV